MSTRKTPFITGEYYHVFNRGVEKRNIFIDTFDVERFFESMELFNSVDPVGSLYELSFNKTEKLAQTFCRYFRVSNLVYHISKICPVKAWGFYIILF